MLVITKANTLLGQDATQSRYSYQTPRSLDIATRLLAVKSQKQYSSSQ